MAMRWEQKKEKKFMEWMKLQFQERQRKARELVGLQPANDNKPKQVRVWDSCYDTYLYKTVPSSEAKPGKKVSVFNDSVSFAEALRKKGFQRLGSGAFSTVYAHPKSDRVIKVTRTADNWIDYALWAAKNGYAGSLAPKVYSFKKFNKGHEFLVSVVERMDKTLGNISDAEDLSLATLLLKKYHNFNNVAAGVFLEDLAPGLASFTKKLQKEFGGLDIHGGNLMVRSDGTVCFTDPVSDYAEGMVTYNRLKASDFTSLAKAIEEYYEKITMAVLPKVSLVLV